MQTIQLTLTTQTYGGQAIGRHNGRAVFVPFALPGEIVRARIIEERKNFSRAELVEIVKASPARIPPRCLHYAQCGGCHYQHISYADQLTTKTNLLRDQLSRIGKIENPPVREMVAAPEQWNYRNNIQFHLDQNAKLGFISALADPARPDAAPLNVIPISECHLPEAALNSLWPTLEFEPGTPLQRVSLRAGDDTLLILESEQPETPAMELESDISVVHLLGEDAIILAGDNYIVIEILGRPFKVSAASFFQVNSAMAAKMVEHLLEVLPTSPTSTLLDVYCGVGLFSAFFAPRVKKVIGIEISPSACEDFAVNLDEFDNVDLYEAPAEDALMQISEYADMVLLDPPRAGLDKSVITAIMQHHPENIAYVSCDPATLARDAARLIAGGYKLKQVTPFDLFPQTYHIESISIFET
ncbi:MAG: class I SAM-dependent RNA methyltransferase [Anaerolineales bacterium]|jgi:23S rRNA (uracil1939-C5)-methyltransferase|nr:class I SAM-dependent RNA methyltransferase [Anaerolineales bacterium]